MTNPAGPETSEQYMAIARRWFTEGWTGNLATAGEIFSEELRTNGVRPCYLGGLPRPGRMGAIGETLSRRGPDHRAGTA
jgi:hypothetical protein